MSRRIAAGDDADDDPLYEVEQHDGGEDQAQPRLRAKNHPRHGQAHSQGFLRGAEQPHQAIDHAEQNDDARQHHYDQMRVMTTPDPVADLSAECGPPQTRIGEKGEPRCILLLQRLGHSRTPHIATDGLSCLNELA